MDALTAIPLSAEQRDERRVDEVAADEHELRSG